MAGTSVGWRNWAGNKVAAAALKSPGPRSPDEVAADIRRAGERGLTVRMAGAGHSFTPAAVTNGIMLRPGGLAGIRSVDAAAGLVTVGAGCPLQVLNAELLRDGLSLANMGDIQVQTVAGAIQTGTHGTGRDVGGMAAQVAGLELVLADGTIATCSADVDPDLFDAARVGLGALGVLTAVTFRVVPAFLLEAREEPMRWSEVIARLDELTRERALRVLLVPAYQGCLTKRNNRADGPARPLGRLRYLLDDEFLSNTVFGVTCRLGHAVPADDQAGQRGRREGAQRALLHGCRVQGVHQPAPGPLQGTGVRDTGRVAGHVLAEIRALIAGGTGGSVSRSRSG